MRCCLHIVSIVLLTLSKVNFWGKTTLVSDLFVKGHWWNHVAAFAGRPYSLFHKILAASSAHFPPCRREWMLGCAYDGMTASAHFPRGFCQLWFIKIKFADWNGKICAYALWNCTTFLHARCTSFDCGTMLHDTAPCVTDFDRTTIHDLSISMRMLDMDTKGENASSRGGKLIGKILKYLGTRLGQSASFRIQGKPWFCPSKMIDTWRSWKHTLSVFLVSF